MGNCLPKLKKKNKVSPQPRVVRQKKQETMVSEILSRSSASISMIVKALGLSEVKGPSMESLITKKEENIIDELKEQDEVPNVRKPVFFQVDFVQGMPHRMPSRLADRIETKMEIKISAKQSLLTEEDEILMAEIMDETETKESLVRLEEQQIIAERIREEHLEVIRDKAKGMGSRPPTRAGADGEGGLGGRG